MSDSLSHDVCDEESERGTRRVAKEVDRKWENSTNGGGVKLWMRKKKKRDIDKFKKGANCTYKDDKSPGERVVQGRVLQQLGDGGCPLLERTVVVDF